MNIQDILWNIQSSCDYPEVDTETEKLWIKECSEKYSDFVSADGDFNDETLTAEQCEQIEQFFIGKLGNLFPLKAD
jgi:hypothetical protein